MENKITPELAEFLGIMVGDGSLSISKKSKYYRLTISGHLENDYKYLTDYVAMLIRRLFNKNVYSWRFGKKNSFAIAFSSKEILQNLNALGLPCGKKSQTIKVPEAVLHGNMKMKAAFLRGLADTDFSVVFHKGSSRKNYTYPIICGATSSKILAIQVISLLKEFKIKTNLNIRKLKHSFSKVEQYYLEIYGRQNFQKWMRFIGFSNENHLTKIAVWKKLGFYLPYTPLNERILILENNKLPPRYAIASSQKAGEDRLVA